MIINVTIHTGDIGNVHTEEIKHINRIVCGVLRSKTSETK